MPPDEIRKLHLHGVVGPPRCRPPELVAELFLLLLLPLLLLLLLLLLLSLLLLLGCACRICGHCKGLMTLEIVDKVMWQTPAENHL